MSLNAEQDGFYMFLKIDKGTFYILYLLTLVAGAVSLVWFFFSFSLMSIWWIFYSGVMGVFWGRRFMLHKFEQNPD